MFVLYGGYGVMDEMVVGGCFECGCCDCGFCVGDFGV